MKVIAVALGLSVWLNAFLAFEWSRSCGQVRKDALVMMQSDDLISQYRQENERLRENGEECIDYVKEVAPVLKRCQAGASQ